VWEGGDVGVPCVGVVDVEAAGVNFVHPEPAIQIRQGRHARANPAWRECILACLLGTVVSVVDHNFVFVGVAEENIGDYVRGVAVDDLVEEVRGVGERVAAVPAGEDVAEDPDAFAGVFRGLEFGDQEGLHA